jgi:hypothetical protein
LPFGSEDFGVTDVLRLVCREHVVNEEVELALANPFLKTWF